MPYFIMHVFIMYITKMDALGPNVLYIHMDRQDKPYSKYFNKNIDYEKLYLTMEIIIVLSYTFEIDVYLCSVYCQTLM